MEKNLVLARTVDALTEASLSLELFKNCMLVISIACLVTAILLLGLIFTDLAVAALEKNGRGSARPAGPPDRDAVQTRAPESKAIAFVVSRREYTGCSLLILLGGVALIAKGRSGLGGLLTCCGLLALIVSCRRGPRETCPPGKDRTS